MGLRAKIFVPIGLTSIIIAAYIFAIWTPRWRADVEAIYQESERRHLESVAEGLVPLLLGNQLDGIYATLDALLNKNGNWVDIRLFDPSARLLYPLANRRLSKDHESHDVRVLSQDIQYLGTKLGTLEVTVDFTGQLSAISQWISSLLSLLLVVMLLFLLSTVVVLEHLVRRPIRVLSDASKRLADGDYEVPLPVAKDDEVGVLIHSFAAMRDALGIHAEKLSRTNEQLRLEIVVRKQAEEELRVQAVELEQEVADRQMAQEKLQAQAGLLENKIDELHEAQEALVRKEKLSILGQLSGSVGHELRNPLGVMSNAVFLLKMVHFNADETTKEYLDIIKTEIDNSLRIITDLLDFARTKPPRRQSVTAEELVRQNLERCAIPENVAVTIDLPVGLPRLSVDPAQMGQVLANFITNAVQAMPDGGALCIAARLVGEDLASGQSEDSRAVPLQEAIAISVTDTGEGISPENMKRLFQPLFTTKAKGIGLGLVVCKNLVEANGGRIEVVSELGKGTTFTLRIAVERVKS